MTPFHHDLIRLICYFTGHSWKVIDPHASPGWQRHECGRCGKVGVT